MYLPQFVILNLISIYFRINKYNVIFLIETNTINKAIQYNIQIFDKIKFFQSIGHDKSNRRYLFNNTLKTFLLRVTSALRYDIIIKFFIKK